MKKKYQFLLLFAVLGVSITFYINKGQDRRVQTLRPIKNVSLEANEVKIKKIKNNIAYRKTASTIKKIDLDRKPGHLYRAMKKENKQELSIQESFLFDEEAPIISGSYQRVENFIAIKASSENIERFPNAYQKLGYLIVPAGEEVEGISIFVNSRTETIAIPTGVVKVSFARAEDYNTGLFDQADNFQEYKRINKVFFKFNDTETAYYAWLSLKNNKAIKRSSLEFIEYQRLAK